MMTQTIRILLTDASPILRAGLRALLAANGDLLVVGEAGDSTEAERLSRELAPRVLLLGPDLAGSAGPELVMRVRRQCPATRVLAIAPCDGPAGARQMLAAGVAGYALQSEAAAMLPAALRAVARGDPWFSPAVLGLIATGSEDPESPPSLSARQRQIACLLTRGWTTKQLAIALHISESTIRFHIDALKAKLGLGCRAELIAWAAQQGLHREPLVPAQNAEGTPENIGPTSLLRPCQKRQVRTCQK